MNANATPQPSSVGLLGRHQERPPPERASILRTEGLCPEAAEFARKAEELYARAATYQVKHKVRQIAEQLFKQGRNAIDRSARAQAIFEAEKREREEAAKKEAAAKATAAPPAAA